MRLKLQVFRINNSQDTVLLKKSVRHTVGTSASASRGAPKVSDITRLEKCLSKAGCVCCNAAVTVCCRYVLACCHLHKNIHRVQHTIAELTAQLNTRNAQYIAKDSYSTGAVQPDTINASLPRPPLKAVA